jgi:hypothetical protein
MTTPPATIPPCYQQHQKVFSEQAA